MEVIKESVSTLGRPFPVLLHTASHMWAHRNVSTGFPWLSKLRSDGDRCSAFALMATKGSAGRWDQHGALTSTAKQAESASGRTHKHPGAGCRTPRGRRKAKSQDRCVVASYHGKFSSCSTKLIPPHLDSIPRQNK